MFFQLIAQQSSKKIYIVISYRKIVPLQAEIDTRKQLSVKIFFDEFCRKSNSRFTLSKKKKTFFIHEIFRAGPKTTYFHIYGPGLERQAGNTFLWGEGCYKSCGFCACLLKLLSKSFSAKR
jgi:hypothetical protein